MLADGQLEDMRQAAYRLGMGFAQAAEAEGDLDRRLALFDAFHRSFASVRLSIALALRLRREAGRIGAEGPDRETERPEALERPENPERPDPHEGRYDERDRDRESEGASLPLLLRTLEGVAKDAATLLPQAAELPTLRELLDRVRTQPAPRQPAALRPVSAAPPTSGLPRTRLSGGTAILTRAAPPRTSLAGLPLPRATGPPRR